jgi:hypothetical protein
MELENKTFSDTMNTVQQFTRKEKYGNVDDIKANRRASDGSIDRLIMGISCDPSVLDYHRDYLERRGFDPMEIEQTYHVRSCKPSSAYSQRILIPYIVQRKTYTFSTRDVSGKSNLKYKHCPVNKSIFAPKELLFGIDQTKKDTCVVVEGVFDVFRIGKGSVATSGTQYTRTQLLTLSKFKRIFLLFDPEPQAQKMALLLGNDLSFCSGSIEIILLKMDTDPGDMKPDDVKLLRKEIFGRMY